MQNLESVRSIAFARDYQPHRGLPPLANLGTFEHAVRPGISVEESVARLKTHHYMLRRLHSIFVARLPAEPIYELKMAFSYHAYLCAEQVSELRRRVGEMREPPLGLERVPHPALELLFDEILAAPETASLLLGIYEIVLPAIATGLRRHHGETHLLADQPTRRLCQRGLSDVQEMLDWGARAIEALVRKLEREAVEPWLKTLRACLDAAAKPSENSDLPRRKYSERPAQFNGRPHRDERFPDPYNMGVNAEVFLYDAQMAPEAKVLMMFYKRLREIDVPEMMASIIAETTDKPWAYYHDMTRQLWDEARHAMMGEVGFVSVGVDWPRHVMVNFTWSLGLNTQLNPLERHAVLYYIEQGLMPKTGKRYEWEVSVVAGNSLAATFQDFDWADEVLHARVGRDWYVSQMPGAKQAVDYGDECWSKVLMNWESWRNQGLTAHRNWWPDLYREYCRKAGVQPDPEALAFQVTYQNTRADLKNVTGSA